VLGYDPDWFTRTLGVLLVVAAGETAWGAELALAGNLNLLAWAVALFVAWLGFLLVIEPGSVKPGRHRHSVRRNHE
jgi:hypothetical protein